MALLQVEKITKIYNTNDLLTIGIKDISLSFNRNEFIVITGASGSGKSTLLNVLGANDSFEEGELYFNDKPTSHYTKNEWAKYREDNISFVFQDFNIIENLTVYENIELALINIKDKKERNNKVLELIAKVGLDNHKHKKTAFLSGGEKQRCVIARALAKNSPILLCDEPTGNLDQKNSSEIAKLLYEISASKLVIIVSHNKEYFLPYATREIEIFDGGVKSDKKIKDYCLPDNETPEETLKPSSNFFQGLKIAWTNYKSRPKFTLSLTLAIFICMLSLFFIHAFMHQSFIKPITTKLETDNLPGKVILTKRNQASFTLFDKQKLSKIVKKPIIFNSTYSGYILNFNKKNYINKLQEDEVVTIKFNPQLSLGEGKALLIGPINKKKDLNFIKDFILTTIPELQNINVKYEFYQKDITLYLNQNLIEEKTLLIKQINSLLLVDTRQFAISTFKENASLAKGTINLVNSNIFDTKGKEITLSADLKSSYIIIDDSQKSETGLLTVELSSFDYNRLFVFQEAPKSISIYFSSTDEAKFYLDYLNEKYIAVLSNTNTYVSDAGNIFTTNILVYLGITGIGLLLGLIISFIFTKSIKVFQSDFVIYKTLGINKHISNLAIFLQMITIFMPSLLLLPIVSLITSFIPGINLSLITIGEYLIIELIGLIIILIVTFKFITIIHKVNISQSLKRGNK